jgi:hypothetical protein
VAFADRSTPRHLTGIATFPATRTPTPTRIEVSSAVYQSRKAPSLLGRVLSFQLGPEVLNQRFAGDELLGPLYRAVAGTRAGESIFHYPFDCTLWRGACASQFHHIRRGLPPCARHRLKTASRSGRISRPQIAKINSPDANPLKLNTRPASPHPLKPITPSHSYRPHANLKSQ